MKDRSMATKPYPLRARFDKVVHTGSCNNVSWIGRQVVLTMSDGTDVRCEHMSGHRKRETAIACATKLVRKLNDSAGIPRDKQ